MERGLRAIPAEKELLQIKLLRAVAHATDDQVPQRVREEHGRHATGGQPDRERLRLNSSARDRSPREVLLEHAAKRIDHDRMMAELLAWDYTFRHVPGDDPLGENFAQASIHLVDPVSCRRTRASATVAAAR
ncbi:hypothetical protein [Rhodococcus sp. 3A]|uniref:hypothetical protein n=1 Tax=Rhodococcus sp. 3A TaxID=2834581 RepID=UPI002078A460|nr:hypothetical protein [Rhodococcus sp. 3A]